MLGVLCTVLATAILVLVIAGISQHETPPDPTLDAPIDLFERYLTTPIPPADGFDFPVGGPDATDSYVDQASGVAHSGWRVALGFGEAFSLGLHPGEDWNGAGGGNTDLGQPVRAVATGRVVVAKGFGALWGNVVVIQHVFYENFGKQRIRSIYVHLDQIDVEPGVIVQRGDRIGTIGRDPDGYYTAHLHLELRRDETLAPTFWPSAAGKSLAWLRRAYVPPSQFIREHRTLPVPQAEPVLVLVDHETHRMRVYEMGELGHDLPVSFGQQAGQKRQRGDDRTPKGMYFVVDRHRGAFGGDWADYFGGHWLKINYPNPWDADWGVRHERITEAKADEIRAAWLEREATDTKTRLGGGIGFHGWIEDWDEDGPRHLSWGCIVMQNDDIAELYDEIPNGAMVVIF